MDWDTYDCSATNIDEGLEDWYAGAERELLNRICVRYEDRVSKYIGIGKAVRVVRKQAISRQSCFGDNLGNLIFRLLWVSRKARACVDAMTAYDGDGDKDAAATMLVSMAHKANSIMHEGSRRRDNTAGIPLITAILDCIRTVGEDHQR